MTISPVTPINSTATEPPVTEPNSPAATVAGTNGLLDPNEFLSLLVDNLKYQDPLDPTSSADFLTQLASLSQVQTEQQVAETDQTSAAANLMGDTVSGSDAAGLPITGVVTGFSVTSNGPTLDVGSDSISLGQITSVVDTKSSTSTSSQSTPPSTTPDTSTTPSTSATPGTSTTTTSNPTS